MPDTQHATDLLQDLQRLNRLHQRLNRTVFAIMCGTSFLLIFEEATGRVTTHGTLSVIWILGLVIGLVWRRRARCSRLDALTLDTVSLLESMIARAKSDLLVARCLYVGVPCGAVVGFFVAEACRHQRVAVCNCRSCIPSPDPDGGWYGRSDSHDGDRRHSGAFKAPSGSGT